MPVHFRAPGRAVADLVSRKRWVMREIAGNLYSKQLKNNLANDKTRRWHATRKIGENEPEMDEKNQKTAFFPRKKRI